MSSNKKYWRSVQELEQNDLTESLSQNEFVSEIPTNDFLSNKEKLANSSTTRRDFLKYVGFTTATVALASCEGPVKKAIPYVVLPEQVRPGIADYYATTIADGFDFASVLVKTREGRPIFIETNKEANRRNSLNPRIIASVLSLYDDVRVKNPKKNGADISWEKIDTDIIKAFESAKNQNKQIVFLTPTMSSPSTKGLISEFASKYPNTKHVQYDVISEEYSLKAFENKYGFRALADYDLSEADVIVSFGADFLTDWNAGGYEKGYAENRIPTKDGKMSKHFQFESLMSLTGANADERIALSPSDLNLAFAKFSSLLLGQSTNVSLPKTVEDKIQKAVSQVRKAGKKAVVLTGIQNEQAQGLVLEINTYISSDAFIPNKPLNIRQGNTSDVNNLVKDMNDGKVGVLIINDLNPIYSLPNSKEFEQGLSKVDFSISFSMKEDETSKKTNYVAATPHYLESWGDVQIKNSSYSLVQPTIRPLFNTRQLQDSLVKWLGISGEYYDYLKKYWQDNILSGNRWEKALHDGFFYTEYTENLKSNSLPVSEYISFLSNSAKKDFELVLYTKNGIGDGRQANNPWLQEFPDPISRVSWDNYLTVSQADAKKLGFKNWNVANGALNGDYAQIKLDNISIKVPVFIQPGQANGTLGIALGYGRKDGMKKEMQVGVNAYPLYKNFSNVQSVTISKAEGEHEFACIQLHNTLMGRGDILKETTLDQFVSKPAEEWNKKPLVSLYHQEVKASTMTLWEEYDTTIGHFFNLSIDLNACTGCGSCVIACHAENNVPVVGKQEVRKSRDMHWLRIDRYYSSEETFKKDLDKKESIDGLSESLSVFSQMEEPSSNPQVVFQPVMCQHCNNAPCETVCPVGATSHGSQGQNHMAYNRCIGTRYCANNCPYKVRRFNWFLYNNNNEFDYHMNNDLGKMVLNPDVVVRSRGVMEKCSFCIQSTQAAILKAKREGRSVKEEEFKTACSSACPSGAMVFGDINQKDSQINKLKSDDRMYHLLEHIGTKPNVFYQVKVRNNS